MNTSFEGKQVLITGGTKGIGKACAVAFASQGAGVTITYSSDDLAAEDALRVVKTIASDVQVIKADMGSIEDISLLVEKLSDLSRIPDVLVCNAAFQTKATVGETDRTLLEKTFRVNVSGNFDLIRLTVKKLVGLKKKGTIIICSSNQSELVNPTGFAYSLSKAALNHMTKHIAVAYAEMGIRVNGVILGWFDTEGERTFYSEEIIRKQSAKNILLGRAGRPEEAANLIAYMASDEAAYMTGSLVRIDGGFALSPDLST